MTLPRNVRAIRALYLHQNVLLELNMQKSLVSNPHVLGKEYRAFIAINMIHELDLLSGDSIGLTPTRNELGSELTKIWGFDGFCFAENMCVERRSAPHRVNSSLSMACKG